MRGFDFQNTGFTVATVAGILVLLFVVAAGLGGSPPNRPDFQRHAAQMLHSVPILQVESLFSRASLGEIVIPTNSLSPFYTDYYIPPPPPKAPEARSVEVVYQGHYESANEGKLAFASVDGQSVTLSLSSKMIGGWFVGAIDLRTLTLTNTTGASTVLKFRETTKIEIPK